MKFTRASHSFLCTVSCRLVFVFAFQAVIPSAVADSGEIAEALRQYFKPLKLLPAVVPSDYTVGDVYEFPSLQLISRSEDCFGELETRTSETSLASGVSERTWLAEIKATLKSFVGLEASGSGTSRYAIRFQDVVVVEAARMDLLSSLMDACASLKPLLEGSKVRPRPLQLPISKVLTAKVELMVVGETDLSSKVEIEGLENIFGVDAKIVPLDASASVEAGLGQRSGWILSTEDVVPVAFLPIVVPISSLSITGDKIVETDPENPVHAAAVGDLSDDLAPTIAKYYAQSK